jgi:5-methylcytosine-specific restriction endonuclease McrA
VHNSSRPLQCHVCHKSFRYQDSLTKHLNIHDIAQDSTSNSELSCIYSFQICGQTFELDSCTKDSEDHSYRDVNLIHNTDKDIVQYSLQQYSISPAAVNSNICIRDVSKATLAVSQRRLYSITVDGNLCFTTDAQNTNILPEVGSIDSSTELPLPLTSLHPLSHPHHGLDLHSVISLTSSNVHEQETHPHIEIGDNPSVPYNEPLFIDNCSQISQEHNKQKMIHNSGRVYSKVET